MCHFGSKFVIFATFLQGQKILSQNGTLGHFDPAKWYFCAEFSS
jgi:hypothetical protein